MGGPGEAKLEQHLRGPWQRQAGPDQIPDDGGFQRLGMQAGEYPAARGVGQEPVQRLAGAEPVCAAIAGREQHRGGGGGRPVGRAQPEAAAQVEVALR